MVTRPVWRAVKQPRVFRVPSNTPRPQAEAAASGAVRGAEGAQPGRSPTSALILRAGGVPPAAVTGRSQGAAAERSFQAEELHSFIWALGR